MKSKFDLGCDEKELLKRMAVGGLAATALLYFYLKLKRVKKGNGKTKLSIVPNPTPVSPCVLIPDALPFPSFSGSVIQLNEGQASTLQTAINNANAGDIIEFLPGNFLNINGSGPITVNKRLLFRSASSTAVLSGGNGNMFEITGSGVCFDNLQIEYSDTSNPGSVMYFNGGGGYFVNNCKIYGYRNAFFNVESDDLQVTGCEFHYTTASSASSLYNYFDISKVNGTIMIKGNTFFIEGSEAGYCVFLNLGYDPSFGPFEGNLVVRNNIGVADDSNVNTINRFIYQNGAGSFSPSTLNNFNMYVYSNSYTMRESNGVIDFFLGNGSGLVGDQFESLNVVNNLFYNYRGKGCVNFQGSLVGPYNPIGIPQTVNIFNNTLLNNTYDDLSLGPGNPSGFSNAFTDASLVANAGYLYTENPQLMNTCTSLVNFF